MDNNNQHKQRNDWTLVKQRGKKIKNDTHISSKKELSTPDDIYYANVNTRVDKKVCSYNSLKDAIMQHTGDLPIQDSLDVLHKITMFTIERMTQINDTKLNEIKTIDDDQKTVIVIDSHAEKNNDKRESINTALSRYDEKTEEICAIKENSIGNIYEFLTSCGIRKTHTVKKYSDKKNDGNTGVKKSYASAIGSAVSDLVVDIRPLLNNTIHPKTSIIDTGVVNIDIPVISKINDCIKYTLSYYENNKVYVYRIDNDIFTAGPCNFINVNKSGSKTKHAKRCLNPIPCRYKNCKYYHDPCVTVQCSNPERNFTLSYVIQLLSNIKDNSDLTGNDTVKDMNFLRDIVHLGGAILLKAAQIKALHFSGKT